MTEPTRIRVGYVVKRYPRFSETFIVNEVLAHEAAGMDVEIFSIRPCNDTHYQNRISEVKAPHTQLSAASRKSSFFWSELQRAASQFANLWETLESEKHADATSICQAIELATLVQASGITHLHAHFATLPTTVTRLAALLARIPYSFTAHAKDIFHESVCRDDLVKKINDAGAVVTVSDFNLKYLNQLDGVKPGRVRRVYNGMQLDDLVFEPPVDREHLILGVGRLVEKKGFEYLIRACRYLKDRGTLFRCLIVGAGDQHDVLRQHIRGLQVEDCVSLEGPMPQTQVKQLLHRASVMAAPCVVGADGNRDGLPTVLLEAMAMGTPCVATAVTGIPEVIRHEQSGMIVAQNCAVELSESLFELLSNVALRERLASNARQVIESYFDSHATSRRIRDVFSQCRRNWADSVPALEQM